MICPVSCLCQSIQHHIHHRHQSVLWAKLQLVSVTLDSTVGAVAHHSLSFFSKRAKDTWKSEKRKRCGRVKIWQKWKVNSWGPDFKVRHVKIKSKLVKEKGKTARDQRGWNVVHHAEQQWQFGNFVVRVARWVCPFSAMRGGSKRGEQAPLSSSD